MDNLKKCAKRVDENCLILCLNVWQVFLHISCWLYKQLKAARRWLRFVNKIYFPPTGESIQRIKTRRAVSQVFSYLKSCLA